MIENAPLVSVIVPCYNDGKYINDCLDSIHAQCYDNYEIILVDDGSIDRKTIFEIDNINHPKIKKYRTENQGPSKTRNFGISKSKGKYIFPLDADNKVGNLFISEAVRFLEKNPETKIVNCDLTYFGAKKGLKIFPRFSIEKLLCENIIECASIFRRSDFDKTIGYNPNMKDGFEDWDFWLSLLENGGKVYKIEKAEIYYRVRKKSRNNSIAPEQFQKLRRQIYDNHKELYSKHFLDPQKCFEYELIKSSKEYLLGKFLLKPIRKIYTFFN